MPHIKLKENEPFDVALRRFKRSCEKAGVLAEVRKREHYEKPTTVRKRAGAAAVKRHLKKLSRDNRRLNTCLPACAVPLTSSRNSSITPRCRPTGPTGWKSAVRASRG